MGKSAMQCNVRRLIWTVEALAQVNIYSEFKKRGKKKDQFVKLRRR